MRIGNSAIILLFLAASCFGDSVLLTDGRTINGVVLKNDDKGVSVRTESGTIGFYANLVESVHVDPLVIDESARVGSWKACLASFVKRSFGGDVQQIPATVVDRGILARVPYISFRSGDYEMNIYGDPEKPACVEIGVYHQLTDNIMARSNCRTFINSVLGSVADRGIVNGMMGGTQTRERDGWKIETTIPTEDDSYGGWWISVYNEKLLDSSRASEKELSAITVAPPPSVTTAPSSIAPALAPVIPDAAALDSGWTSGDYTRARGSGGGSVYVSGYTRKNGTYVHSYTRRR